MGYENKWLYTLLEWYIIFNGKLKQKILQLTDVYATLSEIAVCKSSTTSKIFTSCHLGLGYQRNLF